MATPPPEGLSAAAETKVWRAQARIHMASERTLIAWTRTAATLGAGALFAAIGHQTKKHVHGGGLMIGSAQALVAMVMMCYAAAQYLRRRTLVRQRYHGPYSEACGPGVLAFFVGLGVAADLVTMLVQTMGLTSPLCATLPLPILQNASPPFLYVTFHGGNDRAPTGHDVLCSTGVSGVHRFALDGAYVGPATRQSTAGLMHYPRGMVHSLGMLIVAESWSNDPSLAVYGGCADPLSPRPFQGRIRPPMSHDNPALHAAFAHPYGIIEAADGTLHVSTQNGGAVVSVDVTTSLMHIVEQVEPPRAAGVTRSGPLRGIAIDSKGCEHVAAKHANRVLHYCPGHPTPRHTPVKKPIGLFAHDDVLFVSSLGNSNQTPPAQVLALDLSTQEAGGGHPVIRSYGENHLVHPAGLVANEGILYLLEQSTSSILTYHVASGRFLEELISGLPDVPETLLLVTGKC